MIYINEYACKHCQHVFQVDLDVERGPRRMKCYTCGQDAERLVDTILKEISPKEDKNGHLSRKK